MSDSTPESASPTPPAPRGITQSKVRYRPLSNTRNSMNWKVIAISLVVAVAAGAGLFALAAKRAQDKLESMGHLERTVTLEPGEGQDGFLTSLIGGQYELDVSAHDGPVLMACGILEKGDEREIDPVDVKRIIDTGVRVETGKRHRLAGRYLRGKFFWTVINLSPSKKVEVTIRFNS